MWADLKEHLDDIVDADNRIPVLQRKHFEQDKTGQRPNGPYPELNIKRAAQTRRLVKPLCALLVDLQKRQENYSIGNLAQHVGGDAAARTPKWTQIAKMANLRVEMMKDLEKFYRIIEEEGRFPTPEKSAELMDVTWSFLGHWKELDTLSDLREWRNSGLKPRLWKTTTKTHHMVHLAEYCKFENPKFSWNYAEETGIGRTTKLTRSAAHGTGGARLTKPLMEKYLRQFFLYLHIAKRRAAYTSVSTSSSSTGAPDRAVSHDGADATMRRRDDDDDDGASSGASSS